jgi:hypothetical protein
MRATARVGMSHYDRFCDLSKLHQMRFNFAKLDADATNLDLMVDPSQAFDAAVRKPARQIARTVET